MMGVFGGTFDPVHFGHLRPALEVQQSLALEAIRFIPCGEPPHRSRPFAEAAHRLAMVRRAIEGQAGFIVDERELNRAGPSYMVDTLASLKADYPDEPLCLVLGMDAFMAFDKWHQWQQIFSLAHLVVTHRPGWQQAALLEHPLLGPYVRDNAVAGRDALDNQDAGLVCFMAVTQLAISSTAIRETLAQGRDIRYLLPDAVKEYIHQHQIYA